MQFFIYPVSLSFLLNVFAYVCNWAESRGYRGINEYMCVLFTSIRVIRPLKQLIIESVCPSVEIVCIIYLFGHMHFG